MNARFLLWKAFSFNSPVSSHTHKHRRNNNLQAATSQKKDTDAISLLQTSHDSPLSAMVNFAVLVNKIILVSIAREQRPVCQLLSICGVFTAKLKFRNDLLWLISCRFRLYSFSQPSHDKQSLGTFQANGWQTMLMARSFIVFKLHVSFQFFFTNFTWKTITWNLTGERATFDAHG